MVDKSIFLDFEIDEQAIDLEIVQALGTSDANDMTSVIDETIGNFEPGKIMIGKIVNQIGDDVIIEVGLKSEGVVSSTEFDDSSDIEIGKSIEVLLEAVESDSGLVALSKRKADRIRGWERIVEQCEEGDTIKGKVIRRIKGGLLVDVGVPVFLPASQVDIRRPNDISEYIGRELEAMILKIDEERRNIVISRRRLLEETRASAKNKLLQDIEVGQIRTGVVKNIADFGAFIDLGGLDGLLHITDMSWGRVNHPSEVLKLDVEIEVKILSIDREKEKVALGLKQKSESPWSDASERYKIGNIVKGTVVNIMSYGAFIKLEEGVEGLVHISEMSWTKRISHPGDLLSINEEIDVVVLDVNPAKQEISLGIKQLEDNPWTRVAKKYPPGTVVDGRVRNLANYGAFIEIEEGIDGLLHVSDMSWTKKISHPGELLKKGATLKCIVLAVDQEKQRVALGLKQMTEDPWLRAIPEKYIPGQIVQGHVTKLTNFGVFVELEPDLEGLLHISELSDDKVEGPQDIVKVAQEVEVKILRVDIEDRKIGLSLKRAQWAAEDEAEKDGSRPAPRGGLDSSVDMGTHLIDPRLFQTVPIVQVDTTETASAAEIAEPSELTEPTEPSEPAEPSESTGLTEPSEPAEPSEPTEPPAEPTQATVQTETTETADIIANEEPAEIADEPSNEASTDDTAETPSDNNTDNTAGGVDSTQERVAE